MDNLPFPHRANTSAMLSASSITKYAPGSVFKVVPLWQWNCWIFWVHEADYTILPQVFGELQSGVGKKRRMCIIVAASHCSSQASIQIDLSGLQQDTGLSSSEIYTSPLFECGSQENWSNLFYWDTKKPWVENRIYFVTLGTAHCSVF